MHSNTQKGERTLPHAPMHEELLLLMEVKKLETKTCVAEILLLLEGGINFSDMVSQLIVQIASFMQSPTLISIQDLERYRGNATLDKEKVEFELMLDDWLT